MSDTSKGLGEEKKQLFIADWGGRLVAWFIDLMIIGGLSVVFWFFLRQFLPPTRWEWRGSIHHSLPFMLSPFWLFRPWFMGGISGIFLFIYWTITEGLWARSVGKSLFGLRVVDLAGEKIGLLKAVVESLGKAFFLPLDVVVSLLIPECREKRQRLFNYVSSTVVIKTRGKPPASSVEYIKT